MGEFDLRCLGQLTLRIGGAPIPLGGPKQRAVLATLVLHANQVVSVDHLEDVVWRSDVPKNPRAVLQVYVANLRRALSADGPGGGRARARLESVGTGYRLSLSADELDLLRFDDLTRAAAHQVNNGDLPGAVLSLRSAIALWTGPAFPDLSDWETEAPELIELKERRLAATEDLLDLELALGDHTRVVTHAARLVAEYPFSERLRVAHITALYRAQRQGDALAACRETRQFLSDELGVDPGPEFIEVERAVLRQDPALVAHDVKARPAAPNTLPAAPASFVGRADELAELQRMISQTANRLITLTGPGGTGKTRLALAAAAAAGQEFPDGVYWVALDTVSDPDRVLPTIADAVGIRAVPGADLLTLTGDHLRTQRALLALDNFEHVLDAWPVVANLLRVAPRVTVLVTSRTALRISGEQQFEVPQLELPPVNAPLAAAAYYDAVELFTERARHVDRRFAVDASVVELCRRLDGLPLAIELAAARTTECRPTALLASLIEVLDVLVDGPRDVRDRQRTLRKAIDWSYRLLDIRERQVFDAFAVFAGAPDTTAVVAVVAGPERNEETIAALDSLIRHSLLREVRSNGGDPRYSMLQTVRAFADERLTAGGAEPDTRRRHAQHFLGRARHWTARLHGRQQVEAFTRLHRDRPEFDAALDWANGSDGDGELALRLVGCLWDFWQISGDVAEPRRHTETALRRGTSHHDAPVRAAAASGAGTLCWLQGDLPNARRYHREALDNYRLAGDISGSAWSTMCLAGQDINAGQLEAAESAARQALDLAQKADDARTTAATHTVLGVIAIYREDDRAAEEHQERAMTIARSIGDEWAASKALINLGDIVAKRGHKVLRDGGDPQGEWRRAAAYVAQALRICRRIGDQVGSLYGIEAIAELRLRQGAPRAAARLLGAAHHHRQTMAQPLDAREAAALRDIVSSVRAAAGPVGFAVAWAEGELLSVDDATDHALAESEIDSVQ